jgi:hypothetical protein
MSQTHKVIILNKPLKIFDFTIIQLILMFFSILGAVGLSMQFPKDWKFNGLPAGALVGIVFICITLALVKMSEVKPWAWWLNLLAYRLKAVPTIFIPKPEPAPIYPDPTIIEVKKASDQNYVDASGSIY